MMPGREALASVERGVAQVRREEDRLTEMLRAAGEEAARWRAEKAESFRALARMRLDALRGEVVAGELDAAEKAALAALERGKAALSALQERRVAAADALAAAERARHEAAAAEEAAIEAIDERRAATEQRLRETPEYAAKAAALAEASHVAEESDKKADQAEADRDVKRKPYEADPLFMYLWKRGYGTSAYRAGSLVRFGDRKVADLVGYDGARPNYWMLNEIPRRLREHATARATEAEALEAALAAEEREALEADGIGALEQTLAAAQERLKAADEARASCEAALKAIEAEIDARLSGKNSRELEEALTVLEQAIAREDLATLAREAQATPAPEDERIVARLSELDQLIARADAEIAKTRDTIREVARRRAELEAARGEIRERGYDSPLGGFSNERIIGEVIAGVIGGVLRGSDLGRVMRDGFSRRSTRSGTGFGGGTSWGSGSGSRGSRGGGNPLGKSSGGFRTKGRF